jgi:hypothetical protein
MSFFRDRYQGAGAIAARAPAPRSAPAPTIGLRGARDYIAMGRVQIGGPGTYGLPTVGGGGVKPTKPTVQRSFSVRPLSPIQVRGPNGGGKTGGGVEGGRTPVPSTVVPFPGTPITPSTPIITPIYDPGPSGGGGGGAPSSGGSAGGGVGPIQETDTPVIEDDVEIVLEATPTTPAPASKSKLPLILIGGGILALLLFGSKKKRRTP